MRAEEIIQKAAHRDRDSNMKTRLQDPGDKRRRSAGPPRNSRGNEQCLPPRFVLRMRRTIIKSNRYGVYYVPTMFCPVIPVFKKIWQKCPPKRRFKSWYIHKIEFHEAIKKQKADLQVLRSGDLQGTPVNGKSKMQNSVGPSTRRWCGQIASPPTQTSLGREKEG